MIKSAGDPGIFECYMAPEAPLAVEPKSGMPAVLRAVF